MARSERLVADLSRGVSALGCGVTAYPGENEMQALVRGALRVLRGREKAKQYEPAPEANGMTAIRKLDELLAGLKGAAPRRLAVAAGHDPHTLEAAMRAAAEGVALVTLVADRKRLDEMAARLGPLPRRDRHRRGLPGAHQRHRARRRERRVGLVDDGDAGRQRPEVARHLVQAPPVGHQRDQGDALGGGAHRRFQRVRVVAGGHRQPPRRARPSARPSRSSSFVMAVTPCASGAGSYCLRLLAPAQHAQRAAHQRLHLVLARVGRHAAAQRRRRLRQMSATSRSLRAMPPVSSTRSTGAPSKAGSSPVMALAIW